MHSPGFQPQPVKSRQDARFGVLLTIFCLLIYAEIYFYSSFGPEFPLYYYWGVGESFNQLLQSYGYVQLGWYRPTASAPYWLLQPILDWHNLAGWRIASVLTCAASGYLVYRIALDLFPRNRLAAMLAALYFVTHPDFYLANFEVAGFDFLHIIFSLLAILLYRRSIYSERHSALLAGGAWLCVAIGLTAKEVVIAIPGVLAVMSAIRVWESAQDRPRAIGVELLRLSPMLLVIPGYWYLHGRHIPTPTGASPYHMDFRAGRTAIMYLHLLLWGARIFFVFGLGGADVFPGTWLDNLVGLSVLSVVVWRWSKRKDDVGQLLTLAGWYLLMLVVPAVTAGFMRHTSLSVPAYAILVGVAFSEALAMVPQPRRKQVAWAGGVALSLLTVWNIHREINAGTHALPIRLSESLLAKPPVAPESLAKSAEIIIEDRLGLGAWAYGCYGNLFNFVYKRKDVRERVVAPGSAELADVLHSPSNVYFFRYNDSFEWVDATDELRAATVNPAVAETEPGRPVRLNSGLRRFGKLAWSLMPAGAGTISQDGEYVPPERVPAPMLVRVTAASSAEPQKKATAEIHVFPKWQDVGIGGAAGWHKVEGGTHVLSGEGDIAGRKDRFRFAYQKVATDGSLSAMVGSRGDPEHPWKAGVLIRTSLRDDAPFLFVGTQAGRPIATWRETPGTPAQIEMGEMPFSCFRVDRIGDQLSGSASLDCEHWSSLGPILRVGGSADVFAGLALASGNAPATNVSFVEVRWQPGANPQ